MTKTLMFLLAPVTCLAWDFPSIGGVETPYSQALIEKAKNPAVPKLEPDSNGLSITCFRDPKNEMYIGVVQQMEVNAPLEKVADIVGRFEDYPKWLHELLKNDTERPNPDRVIVNGEQHIPVPLIANARNKMGIVIEREKDRVLFRSQLIKSNQLKAFDGMILLERKDDNTTRFVEYDFWDAHWGVAKFIAKSRIWGDSALGVYQSNAAFKLRAEKPEISDKEVYETSLKWMKEKNISQCLENKATF